MKKYTPIEKELIFNQFKNQCKTDIDSIPSKLTEEFLNLYSEDKEFAIIADNDENIRIFFEIMDGLAQEKFEISKKRPFPDATPEEAEKYILEWKKKHGI